MSKNLSHQVRRSIRVCNSLCTRLFLAAAIAWAIAPAEPASGQVIPPKGAARRWEASMSAGPYCNVNLARGRLLTTIPMVGWEGRGPAISFAMFHNMTSTVGTLPIEGESSSQGLMGDTNLDGTFNEEDVSPFLDIMLGGTATAKQVSVSDFTGDAEADSLDMDGFMETLSMTMGGPDWRHSYSTSLLPGVGNNTVGVTRDDGTKDTFTKVQGIYVPPAGVFETLVRETSGSQTTGWLLTTKNQWRWHYNANGTLDYIADATTATDENDKPLNRLQCAYVESGQYGAGELDYVDDASGRRLDLNYNSHGLLMEIVDPLDRTWTILRYDENEPDEPSPTADGAPVQFQDPQGQLISVVYTEGVDPEHEDTNGNEIWAIADKNEDAWFFTYDDGRVVDLQDPTDQNQELYYTGTSGGSLKTYLTDRRSAVWTLLFAGSGVNNLLSVENPLDETQSLEYEEQAAGLAHEVTAYVNALDERWERTHDASGNVLTYTDPLSNTWTFEYDSLNNLVLVQEPGDEAQTTIDTILEYESSIDPTVVTHVDLPPDQFDERGDIFLDYWGESGSAYALGKLKSVADPNGVETLFRYHSNGQLAQVLEGPISETGIGWHKVMNYIVKSKVSQVLGARQGGMADGNSGGTETSTCVPISCGGYDPKVTYDECGCPVSITCGCVPAWETPCHEEEPEACDAGTGTGGGTSTSISNGYVIPNVCQPEAACSGASITGSTDFLRDNMGRILSAETNAVDDSLGAGQCYPWDITTIASASYDGLGRVLSSSIVTNEPDNFPAGSSPTLERTFDYGYDDADGTYTRTGPDGQTTTTQTDLAGRVQSVTRGGLTAEYAYYPTGRVESVTYGNGAQTLYQYDDAERLTQALHQIVEGEELILQLDYAYTPRGLIETITETSPESQDPTTTTFTYDARGRLIEETRIGTHAYALEYEYDQGGNRTTKTDELSGIVTTYHYDIDSGLVDCDGDGTLESTAKDCYKTKNNRLMFYEVRDAAEELLERVDYQYEVQRNHVGNPTYIVRRVVDPQGPDTFYATTLQYNQAGELWFVGQQSWPESDCYSRELVSLHEFRTSGRAMRMTRERDPDEPSEPLAGTTVWHDYDGEAIYGDVAILGVAGSPPQFVMAETFSHEPGVGQFDVEQTALSFYHGDQIGSLRAVTGDESGDPPVPQVEGRIVYTAFGEPVYVGSVGVPPAGVGTRYQYAGAYGYQSDLYADAAGATPFTHVGHRWYDPSTGRFLQRDPIGIAGGLNVYTYVRNQPLSLVDPNGLEAFQDIDKFLDGVINGKPMGAAGAACGAAFAINAQYRLGIGRQVNVVTVVCAGAWIGWNAGKKLDELSDLSDFFGAIIHAWWEGNFAGNYPPHGIIGCFAEGTLVESDRGLIPIELIRAGECVDSCDPYNGSTKSSSVKWITAAFSRELIELQIDDCSINCTPEHPFFVLNHGWKKASELDARDRLMSKDARPLIIRSIKKISLDKPVRVYNLTVGGLKTFFVGKCRVVVHNKP